MSAATYAAINPLAFATAITISTTSMGALLEWTLPLRLLTSTHPLCSLEHARVTRSSLSSRNHPLGSLLAMTDIIGHELCVCQSESRVRFELTIFEVKTRRNCLCATGPGQITTRVCGGGRALEVPVPTASPRSLRS